MLGESEIRYHRETIASWSEYRKWTDERLRNWSFRGQAKASWQLWTTLSRTLRRAGIHPDHWTSQELRNLRVFKRKAHHFLEHLPDEHDEFQWLALMQHHGAPSRLLDLTWSPEVAAFFALEQAIEPAAVWCFHYKTITHAPLEITIRDERGNLIKATDCDRKPIPWTADMLSLKGIPSDPDSLAWAQKNFERHFLGGDDAFVYLGEPHIMNQRLIAQNATFAVPTVIDKPIDEIINNHDKMYNGLVKLVLLPEMRREAMRSLYSSNVTNATLFPGLDGLAKSMAYELEYHWAIDLYNNVKIASFDDPRAGW